MAILDGKDRADWGSLLADNGLIVSLKIKWFKGQRKLLAEDLELEEKAKDPRFDKLFQLGRKSIIPKDCFLTFQALETRARNVLSRYCYETPFGDFVPHTAYSVFDESLIEIKREFCAAVEDFKKNFPKYRREVLDDYRALAEQLFTNGSKESNTRKLLRAVEKAMPTPEDLERAFVFHRYSYNISIPEADRKNKEKAVEKNTIKYRVNQKLANEYEKKSKAMIDQFLKTSVGQLRQTVTDLAQAGLESIKNNDGILIGRLSLTLNNMIDNFQTMNFAGDVAIADKLKELRANLQDDHDSPKARGDKFTEVLKELKAACKAKIDVDSLAIRTSSNGREL